MPTEKTLSIIIPSYNMETYLPQCLDSLLGPDVPVDLLDIIVVNDGSRDRTSEIAHSYADRYPDSIRVIDKANGNYGSCINAALPTARGRYVKILDADDSFAPESFPAYVRFLTTATADLVLNDYATVDPEGKTHQTFRFKISPERSTSIHELAQTLLPGKDMGMHGRAYLRTIFSGFNYHQTEGISYTDIEWEAIPIVRVNSISYFNKTVYRYLVGRNGQTVNPTVFARNVLQMIKVEKKIIDFLYNNKSNYDAVLYQYLFNVQRRICKTIYASILDNANPGFIKALIDFDKWIQNISADEPHADFSNMTLAYLPKLEFKFIAYWRNNKWNCNAPKFRLRRTSLIIKKSFHI